MSKLISLDDIKDATMASNKAQRETYEQGIRKATLDKVLELIEEIFKLDEAVEDSKYVIINKQALTDLSNRLKEYEEIWPNSPLHLCRWEPLLRKP